MLAPFIRNANYDALSLFVKVSITSVRIRVIRAFRVQKSL